MPVSPKLAERRFWQNRHTGDVSKHSEMYMKNEKRYAQRLSKVSEWGLKWKMESREPENHFTMKDVKKLKFKNLSSLPSCSSW